MSNSPVLGTAIGMILVFLLVALTCTAVVESIATFLKKRAKYLLRGLSNLLDDQPQAAPGTQTPTDIRNSATAEKSLYSEALSAVPTASAVGTYTWTVRLMGHPLIAPFKQSRAAGGKTRNPSYLPARAFASAVVDLLVPDQQGRIDLDQVRTAVHGLDRSDPIRGPLLSLLSTAGDLAAFMSSLERWYDDQMDRISGAYKRWAKRWAIAVGLAVAVLFQVDSVAVARSLYTEAPLRTAVIAAAGNQTLCPQDEDLAATQACVRAELGNLAVDGGLPVGWSASMPTDAGGWLVKLLGWALTAFAATLGAPFWFDALTRIGSLRNTGVKPPRAG